HDEPGDDSPHPHPDECPDLCRQEHSRHADDEEQNRDAVPEHLPAHLRCPPRVYFASSPFCHAHCRLRFCCALCCVSSVPHMSPPAPRSRLFSRSLFSFLSPYPRLRGESKSKIKAI